MQPGKPKKRRYNTRLLKQDYPYAIWEIMERLGVCRGTIRRWFKDGLPLLDQRKRYIYGAHLIAFLDARQNRKKYTCKPDELPCMKCRAPRHPKARMVDITIRNETRLNISGFCELCGTGMNKAGSMKKLSEYHRIFDVRCIHDCTALDRGKTEK